MPKIAILPIFHVKEGHADAFLARIRQQRADALSDKEPGCLHFDILRGEDPNVFTLYEIYADMAAREKHRTYPHYADFKAVTEPMVEKIEITTFEMED